MAGALAIAQPQESAWTDESEADFSRGLQLLQGGRSD
jgi:hypothetical protein